MDENRPKASETATNTKEHSKPHYLMMTGAFAIVLLATSYGVYSWQRRVSSSERSTLQGRIDTLEGQLVNVPDETQKETVEYKTEVGGLTITLPKGYAIIVNVDGNKGGAPGSTLKIGKVSSSGIISDNVYQWVKVEVGHSGDFTLEQEVKMEEGRLKEDGFENIKIVDATVAGLKGKRITADGLGYAGHRDSYLVVSGEFTYLISSSNEDVTKQGLLKTTLDGLNIEPKTLE